MLKKIFIMAYHFYAHLILLMDQRNECQQDNIFSLIEYPGQDETNHIQSGIFNLELDRYS